MLDLQEMQEDYNIVLLCRFGSHLYGTDTPESDVDYKGIYMPTQEEILLGKVKKSINFDSNPSNTKNSKGDIDCELYSFHYFIELCSKGEMVAMDMLHVNDENILIKSHVWDKISNMRSMFYTTEMKAFAGYAKKQAAKYGEKGSRINSAEDMLNYLSKFADECRMFEVWHELPTDENMYHKVQPDGGVSLRCMQFMFCGKTIQSTASVGYIYEMVSKFKDSYGHRATLAAVNDGVDWKALSHAVRAAYQMQEIYLFGDLTFPLGESNFLKDVKLGKFKYEYVLEVLEKILTMVDLLSKKSSLPEAVNQNRVNKFIIETVRRELFN